MASINYKAKVDTLLKKAPIQGEDLPNNEKVNVPAGKIWPVDKVLEYDGLHSRVELGSESGTWWIFLPHWDIDLSGQQVKAVFSLKRERSTSLIEGDLVFSRGSQVILKVKATSGLAGHQYAGAERIRAKGCIPPGTNWKISTDGYALSTTGVEGMFYHITPDPHPGTGRSEFGLHRDASVPGSAGCIVVCNTSDFNNKVQPLLDGLKNTQRTIPLSVIYT